jgi:hypothetical protein
MYIQAYPTDMAIQTVFKYYTEPILVDCLLLNASLSKTFLHVTGLVSLACGAMVPVHDWALLSCRINIPFGYCFQAGQISVGYCCQAG